MKKKREFIPLLNIYSNLINFYLHIKIDRTNFKKIEFYFFQKVT